MSGKQIFLVVLLVILGGSLIYRFYGPALPQGDGLWRQKPSGGRQVPLNLNDYTVRTDLLTEAKVTLEGGVVNIFSQVARPVDVSKAGKAAATAKGSEAAKVLPAPPPTIPAPPPPPPKTPEQLAAERAVLEMERFRFLGFVRRGESRSMFLGRGDELLVVREGEMVKGLYNIKLIGKDYLVLSDPGTGMEKRIDLTGK